MLGYRGHCRSLSVAAGVLLGAAAANVGVVARGQQPTSAAVPASAPARDVQAALAEVRAALSGEDKHVARARPILLNLVEQRRAELTNSDLCHALVYLGYSADLEGDRATAVKWFEQALKLNGPDLKWIREVAERGLNQPITWIRHLDETPTSTPASTWQNSVIEKIGRARVCEQQPPEDLQPDPQLAREQFGENFEALCEAIDRYYAFFQSKGIDWPSIVARYRPQVAAAATPEEFYALLAQLVRELDDAHSWPCNGRIERYPRGWNPGVEIRRIEEQAVVTAVSAEHAGVQVGTVITSVDGVPVPARIAQLRASAGPFSSERARLEELYRRLLDGPENSLVKLTCRAPGAAQDVTLELRRAGAATWEPAPPAFPITRGNYVWSGVHPSGYGYIRIPSFSGREEIAAEFDRALEPLKDTPGLIVDIRDNLGGFGSAHAAIVGRFIAQRMKTGAQFIKSGRGHSDFVQHSIFAEPTGSWQYSRPVALLLNSRTGSAADLFAAYFSSTGRPLTVGTTTHGNLSGTAVYVVLPCNLVVRISHGYICDAHGRMIEGQGNEPVLHVEPTIADVAAARDTVLERAIEALRERAAALR